MSMEKGGFTLPGESGYEELTLQMAEKWGADVIRDSDGTVLSDEITQSGYGIYSTICIIRDHNAWAKENNVTLITEEHMKIINDKRSKEKSKK